MSLRLLLNENFPAPSVPLLRAVGYDVLAVAEAWPGAADAEVLALAVREMRWLVTFDRDYGELLFARRLPALPAGFTASPPLCSTRNMKRRSGLQPATETHPRHLSRAPTARVCT